MPTGRIRISSEVGECFAVNVYCKILTLVKSVFVAFVDRGRRGIPGGHRKRGGAGRAGVARLRPRLRLGLGAAMRRCV
jgi:hypothetical protein